MASEITEGLSVLVPVFNWDSSDLLESLHTQGLALNTGFELVVADDCSSDLELKEKVAEKAASLEKCRYFAMEKNMGRAAIRNFLAEQSVYSKLLFVDCDAQTDSETFLASYLEASSCAQVVCGGLKHPSVLPASGCELRYRYEKKADRRRGAEYRSLRPYDNFTTFSFLADREVFMKIRFDENITGYGYEDVKFGMSLRQHGIGVLHTDNALVHLGIDDNVSFIEKTNASLSNIYENRDSVAGGSRLLNVYFRLERLHLVPVALFFGRAMSSFMERNLRGSHPCLAFFSFYKLYRLSILFQGRQAGPCRK